MNGYEKERRNSKRLDLEEIPKSLRSVSITTNSNASYLGSIIDISALGIKLQIPDFLNNSNEVKSGRNLRITFVESAFSITGQCVHNNIKEETLDIGLFIAGPDEQVKYKSFLTKNGLKE